jgi:flagellar capping protein FliD
MFGNCGEYGMAENVLQTLQQLIQDVIAPDVRELKVRVSSLEKQMDVRFDAVDIKFAAMDSKFAAMDSKITALDSKFESRFAALENKMDSQFHAMDQKLEIMFKAIMTALSESRAQAELSNFKVIAALSERVAVLEAQRH